MPGFNTKGIVFETFPSGPVPSTDRYSIYVKDDGNLYIVDDLGVETLVGQDTQSTILSDITASLEVGGVEAGEVVPEGTTFDEFARAILLKTFEPTFTSPSVNLTEDIANNLEVGTITNVTLTANFDRGSINGDLVSGIWNPSVAQDFRSGPANNYTIDGVDNDLVDNLVVSSYQISAGANTWSTTVDYDAGPQPVDSDGNNFGSSLTAGSVSDSVTVNGYRNAFYGVDASSNTPPASSGDIRALSGTSLNPSNGTTFTINIPLGSDQVIFAYPATLQDVTSVKYVEGLNAEVKGNFTQTTFNVEGANGFSAINYKVYYYSPVEPFTQEVNYEVTI